MLGGSHFPGTTAGGDGCFTADCFFAGAADTGPSFGGGMEKSIYEQDRQTCQTKVMYFGEVNLKSGSNHLEATDPTLVRALDLSLIHI